MSVWGIDVNGTFRINGGFLVVSQRNSPMVEVPSGQSTQRSVLLRTGFAINAGTLFHIEDTGGTCLLTFAPAHRYAAILFSSAELTGGTSYRLYTGGTYSGGTLRTTFTSTGMVQIVDF